MNKKKIIKHGIIAVLALWILAASGSVTADIVPPELIADRPVKFNYETKILTLTFNEAIDALPSVDVDLRKLTIRNYKFDVSGNIVVDKSINLVGATVTEGFSTVVTITLTDAQRDILKGDKPELAIAAGAVRDLAGNLIAAVPNVNVNVTPPLLSSVESKYEGSISGTNARRLTLTFSNEIQREYTDATKIIVANDPTTGDSFSLQPGEVVPAGSQPADVRAIAFDLTKEHRNILAGWQKDKSIYIRLQAGAVRDEEANYNAAATTGEKITWIPDVVGPMLLSGADFGPSYNHYTKELVFNFDESIRVQYSNGATPDGSRVKIQDRDNPVNSVTLSNDERAAGQSSGTTTFKFIVSDAHRDTISRWRAAALRVHLDAGAFQDIAKLPGTDTYNSSPAIAVDIPDTKWIRDTTSPVLLSAVYSPATLRLSIRFSEAISINPAEVILSKMWVFSATESASLAESTKDPMIDGNTLIIYIISPDTPQHKIIVDSVDPQVRAEAGAVKDLAGNSNSESVVPVVKDTTPPVLSTTGNSYTHEHDPSDNDPWLKGILTLTFVETVDVSTLTDLSKISLKAGTTTVALNNDVAEVTTTVDGTTVEIRTKNTDAAKAKVNEISGLGREYTTLYVELAAETIKDMAGNSNALINRALDIWTKDSVKPTLNEGISYYIHDAGEAEAHRTWLVLVFREQMDTRAGYINAANIEVANQATGGDSITLTQAEIASQDFNTYIIFYINEEHRDTISRWGAPTSMGDTSKGAGTLYVRLIADAVSDRAGNGNATMSTRVALGTWIKDIVAPEYVSSAYNANNKQFSITFKEWMDAKPTSLVDPSRIRIYDKDMANPVTLAGASPTENDKTKTVEITLTPAQDLHVKALAKPLKLNMDVGAAKDIAGNNNAAVWGKEITYTEDTTPPGWAMKDSYLDSRYWHADKRLELNFNEAIDRDPYTDIDATKITLLSADSGGESFTLTQAEIERKQPGDIVLPDPPYVNKINFILSSEHWATVAKWSRSIYVQIAAGAVKDTTTANAIPAIGPIQIHPDNVQMDTTPPDVRLPESYVKEAAVGTPVTITATVTDDISVKWARLYYQVGGTLKAFIVMTNTTGATYVATIPGSAVTNKGLCYYILAEDHVGNRNMVGNQIKTRKGDKDEWWYTNIPGGFNITVKGANVTLPANTLPIFDVTAVPSKYRMISVPIDTSTASTTLFAPFGAPGVDWQAWRYTEAAEYNGYQPGHSGGGFTLSEGEAAWIGTVKPNAALTVAGTPLKIAADNNDYKAKITLRQGWNQIGCPFNFSRSWDGRTIGLAGGNIMDGIYWFTGETSADSFASTDPTVPNQTVFADSWIGSGIPDNERVWSGWPGSLDRWGGYWMYAYKEGAKLKIDPTVPGKAVMPPPPSAPLTQMPYNWSVKVMPEASGVSGTAMFAGIVADTTDGVDKYDVMDLPTLPGQIVHSSFITEAGDYLQDMKAPTDEMLWFFKVSSTVDMPVTLRFDVSAVPSEYRTILLLDTVTEAKIDLRKVALYAYKPSEKIRKFKLIISMAHPGAYTVP